MDDRQRAFADGLTKEERLLIAIRDELYEGSWDDLVEDLEARKGRKPHIFKLATRLEEDLARVDKLRAFEREQSIDLRTLLEGSPSRHGPEARPAQEGRATREPLDP